jgi:hypothetical protein
MCRRSWALDLDETFIPDQSIRRSAKFDFWVEPESSLGDKIPGMGFIGGTGNRLHFGSTFHVRRDKRVLYVSGFPFRYQFP